VHASSSQHPSFLLMVFLFFASLMEGTRYTRTRIRDEIENKWHG
jgi:hypothetical protein